MKVFKKGKTFFKKRTAIGVFDSVSPCGKEQEVNLAAVLDIPIQSRHAAAMHLIFFFFFISNISARNFQRPEPEQSSGFVATHDICQIR